MVLCTLVGREAAPVTSAAVLCWCCSIKTLSSWLRAAGEDTQCEFGQLPMSERYDVETVSYGADEASLGIGELVSLKLADSNRRRPRWRCACELQQVLAAA